MKISLIPKCPCLKIISSMEIMAIISKINLHPKWVLSLTGNPSNLSTRKKQKFMIKDSRTSPPHSHTLGTLMHKPAIIILPGINIPLSISHLLLPIILLHTFNSLMALPLLPIETKADSVIIRSAIVPIILHTQVHSTHLTILFRK